jgi:3D (Asp-Asp-Asp) domain-containing protein
MTNILTAYCACAICCPLEIGRTAAGTVPVEGRTIAAPRNIPLFTKVEVTVPGRWTNKVFIVEDRTSKRINGWDLYLRSHSAAKQWGKKKMIWRIKK